MDTISDISIAKFAQGAGFNGADLITATAIALAESQGNVIAHNGVPPDDSFGLWQINMLGNLRAKRLQSWGLSTPEQLYDPATNARAAFSLYRGRGGSFGDWTTFTGKRPGGLPPIVPPPYKAYVPRATAAWAALVAAGTSINPPKGTPDRPAPVPPAIPDRTPPVPAMVPDKPQPAQQSSATLPGLSWAARFSLFLSWISSLIKR